MEDGWKPLVLDDNFLKKIFTQYLFIFTAIRLHCIKLSE